MNQKVLGRYVGETKEGCRNTAALEKKFTHDYARILREPEFVKKEFKRAPKEIGKIQPTTLKNLTAD